MPPTLTLYGHTTQPTDIADTLSRCTESPKTVKVGFDPPITGDQINQQIQISLALAQTLEEIEKLLPQKKGYNVTIEAPGAEEIEWVIIRAHPPQTFSIQI